MLTRSVARRRFAATIAVLGLASLAACGSDSSSSPDTPPATTAAAPSSDTSEVAATTASTETSATTATTSVTKEEVLKLGNLEGYTGIMSTVAEAVGGGLNVAVQDINDAGGFVVGDTRYTLEIVTVDGKSNPADTSAGATELIRDDGVKVIFGPDQTTTGVVVQQQTSQDDVLWITDNPSVPDRLFAEGADTELNRLTFATQSGAADIAAALAEGVKQFDPDAKTMALVMPNASSYDLYTTSVAEAFRNAGFDLPDDNIIRFDDATTDFTPILTRVKGIHPDVMYSGVAFPSVLAMAQQSAEIGDVFGLFVANSGKGNLATELATGSQVPYPLVYWNAGDVSDTDPSPEWTQFFERFKEVNGKEPPDATRAFAPLTVGVVKALVAAMQAAGTVSDVDKIAEAMLTVRSEGPLGEYSWDETHVPKLPTTVCIVQTDSTNTCTLVPNSRA